MGQAQSGCSQFNTGKTFHLSYSSHIYHPIHRMHESICQFPSDTLYASKLECHDSVAQHLLKDLPGVNDDPDVLGVPVVFFDTSGCEYYERVDDEGDEGSRRNENEAMVVKNWVEKLVTFESLVVADSRTER